MNLAFSLDVVKASKATQKPGRIARINAGDRYVFGHDSACPDDCTITDGNWKNSGICSYAHTIANRCGPPEVSVSHRNAGIKQIIDKHRPMRNEAIVPDRDEVTNECVRLNSAPLTDRSALLYFDKGANEAVVAYGAPVEVDGLHHGHVPPELNIDNSGMSGLRSSSARPVRRPQV